MSQDNKKTKRKDAKNDKSSETDKKEDNVIKNEDNFVKPKYGPYLTTPYQKLWSRSVLILGVLIVVWYNSKRGKEIPLAKQKDVLLSRTQNVDCSSDYALALNSFPECLPEKCGRYVSDKLVSGNEADILLKFAMLAINAGKFDNAMNIFDLHNGVLTGGNNTINVYDLEEFDKTLTSKYFAIYTAIRYKIQHAISHHFGVDINKIYLTKPTFFSKITSANAENINDNYWLPSVDIKSHESFHYTSLLHLSDYGRNFEGGKFIFIDENNVNSTVEPRKGRVTMFTSGAENLHAVERVTSGTRYDLTISFTCDQSAAISDPQFFDKHSKSS